jgi:hypothetical protein
MTIARSHENGSAVGDRSATRARPLVAQPLLMCGTIVDDDARGETMSCECRQLDEALVIARAVAASIERYVASGGSTGSIYVRLARAHALGTCDDLERAIEDHRRGGQCREEAPRSDVTTLTIAAVVATAPAR